MSRRRYIRIHEFCKVITIVVCDMQLEDIEGQITMQRCLNRVMEKNDSSAKSEFQRLHS